MCGTVVLDVKLDTLQHRVANSIYESARSGQLELQGFPDFTPVVTSLRDKADETGPASYKVCVQKHANLCVLQSLAKQWLESDMFRDEATVIVKEHNASYNSNGEWLENDERTSMIKSFFWCNSRFPNHPRVPR